MNAVANHRNDLKQPLIVSAALHASLLVALLISFPQSQRGEVWGGAGGSAIQVQAVRSLPGVPLPSPPVVTRSRVATELPGLHKAPPEPPAKREEPPAKAAEIPRFGQEPQRQAAAPVRRVRRQEPTPPLPPGAIPSESAGPPPLPYTPFQAAGVAGEMSFGGGGAFGSRYPWYVESVQRRISSNWLLATIDPYVMWAPRAVITFEILRNGTVVNPQMTQSSGVPSVDRSALRAIQESSPLDRLPSDYSGDKVMVEFWFEFRRP